MALARPFSELSASDIDNVCPSTVKVNVELAEMFPDAGSDTAGRVLGLMVLVSEPMLRMLTE